MTSQAVDRSSGKKPKRRRCGGDREAGSGGDRGDGRPRSRASNLSISLSRLLSPFAYSLAVWWTARCAPPSQSGQQRPPEPGGIQKPADAANLFEGPASELTRAASRTAFFSSPPGQFFRRSCIEHAVSNSMNAKDRHDKGSIAHRRLVLIVSAPNPSPAPLAPAPHDGSRTVPRSDSDTTPSTRCV